MNIGEYVRTRNGLIFKITGGNIDNWDLDISFDILESFEENWLELYKYNDNGSFFDNKNIVKSSPQIIDLIEIGDILLFEDGSVCRIMGITDDGYYLLKDYGSEQYYERKEYINDLKYIVTHEQMEAIQYRVEE